jgi:hypothetical protein
VLISPFFALFCRSGVGPQIPLHRKEDEIVPEHFNPYRIWLGIPFKDQPPTHYRLLAIELFEDNIDVIRDAAEQRMAHVRTYHLGQQMALSQQILNELAAAKVCLLDPQAKAEYDQALRTKLDRASGAAIPPQARKRPVLAWMPVASVGVVGVLVVIVLMMIAEGRRGDTDITNTPVAPVTPEAGLPRDEKAVGPTDAALPPRMNGDATLLGKWDVTVGVYHATWTFLKNGTVLSNISNKPGTWKVDNSAVHVTWGAQAWDNFDLPLDPQNTIGDSWQGKRLVKAVKIETAGNTSTPLAVPQQDRRTRWISDTYTGTVFVWVQDRQWSQVDAGTRKTVYSGIRETARTPQYIELLFPTRNETYRLFDRQMHLKRANGWSWAHNGHWDR